MQRMATPQTIGAAGRSASGPGTPVFTVGTAGVPGVPVPGMGVWERAGATRRDDVSTRARAKERHMGGLPIGGSGSDPVPLAPVLREEGFFSEVMKN